MKTILKNKWSYQAKIGHPTSFGTRKLESVDQDNPGNQLMDSTSDDDEANNGEDNMDFSNSDEDEDEDQAKGSNGDMDEESSNSASAGPGGTKRKVMESVRKGKQRKA